MINRLNQCLRLALHLNVSDIYFKIIKDEICIEMKVNERLRKLKKEANDLNFFRFLMYKSNIDIGNNTRPQTGQFNFDVDNTSLSLRFAVIRGFNITSGVLRILNKNLNLSIEDLTYDINHTEALKNICRYPNGLFVFSGPTGSGKTTSLYTILNECNAKKIYTLEDPIEIYSEKYIQLQINSKAGLDYATGIKQLLRHNPDIIMIGEIRDEVAAKMAIRAALTGHLILTSIHSSYAFQAIDRLEELGVSKILLRDVLRGIFNQRLFFKDNKKIGIYEYMDRGEIDYYFKYKENSDEFLSLNKNIEYALRARLIDQENFKESIY